MSSVMQPFGSSLRRATPKDDNGGTAGIAYTGVTCDKDPQLRSTLNEYTGNDLTSGQVIRLKQE